MTVLTLNGKNLLITIILNIIITISQIVGGLISGSLALLSDAVHNFSDVLALVIAWGANQLANEPNTKLHTFGYKRAEILATLFNASVLIGVAIFLIIEAIHKFIHPEPIESNWVIWLGILSIVLNSASVLLVKSDAKESINIKAAYLHLLTDVMTSVAVVVGGVMIHFWKLYWIDPTISIFIALYLIWASIDLVKESITILMQFTPKGINIEDIANEIEKENEIDNIHHIHIWQLNDKQIFLEAHLDFKEDLNLSQSTMVIDKIEKRLHDIFGIEHSTFQCEYNRKDNKERIVK